MKNPLQLLKQLNRKTSDSLQKETDKKKQESRAIRKKEKVISSEMELMVCQLTTIVRDLEEYEFWNIA